MLRAFVILVLFCAALSADDSDIPAAACCSECRCNVSRSGECSMRLREQCAEGTCLHVDLAAESSIVDLEVLAPDGSRDAELRISEFERDSGRYVQLEARPLVPGAHRYRSRSSRALLCLSARKPMDVHFSFRELEYLRLRPSVPGASLPCGEAEVEYVPNSVSLVRLTEEPGALWSATEVRVRDLEVDTQGGEYLLVGTGDVPSRFVSEVPGCAASFYVAGGSVSLEFAAGHALKKRHAFTVQWNRTGAAAPPSISPLDSLNAVLVCFSNDSRGTFQLEEVQEAFREAFADSVANYTAGKADCSKSSVHLLGPPTEERGSGLVSVLLALECAGRSFKYRELRSLLHAFETEHDDASLGFKVGLCPASPEMSPYVEKWSALVYALVPAFGLCILLVWAWKNDIFDQRCGPEKEEEEPPLSLGLESSPLPAEPNTYEQTIPKVCVDDGQGRRQTLVQGSAQQEDAAAGAGNERYVSGIASEPEAVSSASDTLLRALAVRKSRQRPGGDESDHLYDSVGSSKAMDETKL